MPVWIHMILVGVPSLAGAIAGIFLPGGRIRYLLGWIGASVGFAIGFFFDLALDPPLVMDPSMAIITVPLGSAIWGLIPYFLALCIWFTLQQRNLATADD